MAFNKYTLALLMLSIGTAASTEDPTGTPGLPHREVTEKDVEIAWLVCLAFFALLVVIGVLTALVVQEVMWLYSDAKEEAEKEERSKEDDLAEVVVDKDTDSFYSIEFESFARSTADEKEERSEDTADAVTLVASIDELLDPLEFKGTSDEFRAELKDFVAEFESFARSMADEKEERSKEDDLAEVVVDKDPLDSKEE